MAVIYLRVSSTGQLTGHNPEGYSIEGQREACVRHAERLGAQVVAGRRQRFPLPRRRREGQDGLQCKFAATSTRVSESKAALEKALALLDNRSCATSTRRLKSDASSRRPYSRRSSSVASGLPPQSLSRGFLRSDASPAHRLTAYPRAAQPAGRAANIPMARFRGRGFP